MPSFEVSRAQESDAEELAQLYRRGYPGIAESFRPEVQHQSQTFIVRSEGRLVGLALVGRVDYGPHRFGVVYELEVAREADYYATGRLLIEAGRRWLTELGTSYLWVTPSSAQERALFHSLGFRDNTTSGMSCPMPVRMPRRVFV